MAGAPPPQTSGASDFTTVVRFKGLNAATGYDYQLLVDGSPVPFSPNIKRGSKDPWDGFPEERAEIFSWIAKGNIEGVLLIAADRHRTDLHTIENPGSYRLYEFESSRLTNRHTHPVVKTDGLIWGHSKTCSFGMMRFDTTKKVGDRELKLHLFHPKGFKPSDRRPAYVAIHGGGWRSGTPRLSYEGLTFWQPEKLSPEVQGYHWNRNAKNYVNIGLAMGDAMSVIAPGRCPFRPHATGGPGGVTLTWQNGTEIPTSVRVLRNSVEIATAEGILIHQPDHPSPLYSHMLATLGLPDFPTPVGVIRKTETSCPS